MNLTNTVQVPSFALFAKGFRCFFLGAALLAAGSIGIWFLLYSGFYTGNFHYYPATFWHRHEMVFGYSGAVIAGFLLTAVSNWTGRETLKGVPLACLFAVWLSAHSLPFIGAVPGWLIAALNVLFYIALAVSLALPIAASRNYRNFFVVAIVTILAICNALVHAQLLGFIRTGAITAIAFAFYLQLLLIVIIAGRVFPMFSAGGVANRYEPVRKKWIEISAVISFIVFVAVNLLPSPKEWQLLVTVLAVIIHSWRVAGWFNWQIFSVPLVWVLHIGYYFLIVGMLMTGVSAYLPETRVPGLHAMLVGALGLITIGMMARVSLGHTGRSIHQPPRATSVIFIGVLFAALIRTLLPLVGSAYYLPAIKFSGFLWALSFLLFVIVYLPYLLKPRVDGAAG